MPHNWRAAEGEFDALFNSNLFHTIYAGIANAIGTLRDEKTLESYQVVVLGQQGYVLTWSRLI